jgi:hypothetical protein
MQGQESVIPSGQTRTRTFTAPLATKSRTQEFVFTGEILILRVTNGVWTCDSIGVNRRAGRMRGDQSEFGPGSEIRAERESREPGHADGSDQWGDKNAGKRRNKERATREEGGVGKDGDRPVT